MIKILKSKLFLHSIGYIITGVCFYFIYLTLKKADLSILGLVKSDKQIFFFILLIVLTSITSLISAYSWKLILEFVSNKSVSVRDVFIVYVKTNIAKYLPGNIFHYVGRNLIGKKMGWTHAQVTLSTVIELAFVLVLPPAWILLFYIFGLISIPMPINFNFSWELILLISAVAGLFLASLYSVLHFFYNSQLVKIKELILKYLAIFTTLRFIRLFSIMAIFILISFLLNGYLFFLTGKLLLNVDLGISKMLEVTSALAIASYSSILTPGVPGGIGIKETITVYLVGLYGYEPSIFMIILLISRVITILSELLLFGISFAFSSNSPKQKEIDM